MLQRIFIIFHFFATIWCLLKLCKFQYILVQSVRTVMYTSYLGCTFLSFLQSYLQSRSSISLLVFSLQSIVPNPSSEYSPPRVSWRNLRSNFSLQRHGHVRAYYHKLLVITIVIAWQLIAWSQQGPAGCGRGPAGRGGEADSDGPRVGPSYHRATDVRWTGGGVTD